MTQDEKRPQSPSDGLTSEEAAKLGKIFARAMEGAIRVDAAYRSKTHQGYQGSLLQEISGKDAPD
jgi:hypothetical protein